MKFTLAGGEVVILDVSEKCIPFIDHAMDIAYDLGRDGGYDDGYTAGSNDERAFGDFA